MTKSGISKTVIDRPPNIGLVGGNMVRIEGSLSDLWSHYTQLSERGKKSLCSTAKQCPILKEDKVIGIVTQASYERDKWIGYIFDDAHVEISSDLKHIHSISLGKNND